MAISNLVTPNQAVPNLLKSLAPKKQGLIPPAQTQSYPQSLIPTPKTAPAVQKPVAQQLAPQVQPKSAPIQQTAPSQAAPSVVNPNLSFTTPQQSAPVAQPQATRGLFSSVVTSLANRGTERNPITDESINRARQLSEDLTQSRKYQIEEGGKQRLAPIPKGVAFGRQANVEQQYQAQQAALSNQLANEAAIAGIGQAERAQQNNALSAAAGFASPRSADVFVDPLTGKPINNGGDVGSQLANWASIRAGAQTAGQFTGDYQQGLATLRAADSIGNQIVSTLQANPTLNSQPLSAITNLTQLISGQISSGPQQLLSQQIAQYIQTLGLDSNTVMNIASQQQGTLGQLLDSIREMAGAQIEAKNPQNIINNPQGTNQPSTGGTPQIVNTSVGPIDNAWF